ncbi:efflux RND transporter permease subunit [Tepidamorphus sp. 3E244]|uniref:efflux RND transporter permease subunit n=1 Tax=Tepidamorphus sp. 3E244 TaxID=3385498 RepID=UPI0038FBE8BD
MSFNDEILDPDDDSQDVNAKPKMGPIGTILSHPRAVVTVMIAMLIGGILSYVTIPKEANPDIDVPVFYVSIAQQGISPEDAERLLIRPMETELRGLDGLKEITGIASEGHAGIVLEFDISFDKDQALLDVREKVDQAQAELPADAEEPQVIETNFSLIPTIVVNLSGNVPERTLYQYAKNLQDRIESISTVLEATLSGQRDELVEVIVDQTKLESYNISQQQLYNAVTNNNRMVAAGSIETGQGSFNVKVPGLFETTSDIYSIPISQNGDALVTLGDVAEIRRTFKDASTYSRFDGKPSISLEVKKRLGTNIVENNAAVRDMVKEATAEWPDAINVDFALDESSHIFEVLSSLQSSIITAICLVMIVVVAALGARSALLVGFAIPTSFLLGFLIINLAGMTVNIMVLFGLVLTTGMLVDGAIVIVEYAERKMAEGVDPREAYIRAAQRMFWPVFSSTATTLAAFIPMLLWPGVAGEFMSYLPLMVIVVLAASIVTAMVFLPVTGGLMAGAIMASHNTYRRLIGRPDHGPSEADLEAQKRAKLLAGNSQTNYAKVPGITGVYVRSLAHIIRWPALVIVLALGTTVAVFYLFGQYNNGVEFFVEEEPERAVVMVSARGNLSPQEMRDIVVRVENEVVQVPGVKHAITVAGTAPAGQPKLGESEDKPVDSVGQVTIELNDYCCRRMASEIFDDIRARTADMPGMRVEIRKIEGGPPTGKDIRLEVTAQSYDKVLAATARISDHFKTGMEGLRDIEDSRPLPGIEWRLNVDREQAARFGADITAIGVIIQLVTDGVLVGTYRPDDSDDEIDIRVRLPEDERSLEQMDGLRVQTERGLVPLSNFVTREAQPKVTTITRQNGAFSMQVKANVQEGLVAQEKVDEVDAWLKGQEWQNGVAFRFRGADEDQKESMAFLGKAAMAAVFLMFVILVTQFNSFYQTILTLMTVILGVTGVLIGMLVTGQRFSVIMTGTGVVALAGIVVNNAIVLMDTYNRMHRELGVNPIDAILQTAAQRLRPIFLTTFTTMMGLIPMATQVTVNFFAREVEVGGITSTWWVQLSTAIIFGLGFSTLLTLIVIPTMLAAPTVFGQQIRGLVGFVRQWFGFGERRADMSGSRAEKAGSPGNPANDRDRGNDKLPAAAE